MSDFNFDLNLIREAKIHSDINQVPKKYRDLMENSVVFSVSIARVDTKNFPLKSKNNVLLLNDFLNNLLSKNEDHYSLHNLTTRGYYNNILYNIGKRININFDLEYEKSRNFFTIEERRVILFTDSKSISSNIKLRLT